MLTDARPTPQPISDPGVEAWVIEDARRRQRRQHRAAGLLSGAAAIAALILWLGGGGGGTASPRDGAYTAAHRIHVGALTVSLPAGWQRVVERGSYRSCTNPIIRLDLASYRLPVGFGKHEGPIVVPANGILLSIVSAPVRSVTRGWQQWRLPTHAVQPTPNLGPNRYAAEVTLPSSPAAGATAWLGSNPPPQPVLAAATQLLRSVRISQAYGCN